MVKQRTEEEHQKVAKAAIKSTRKTTIRKPAKPSRREHLRNSTVNAVWVIFGVAICVVVVAAAVLVIDWLVYKHSCDYEDELHNQQGDELMIPATQCRRHSIFFLEQM